MSFEIEKQVIEAYIQANAIAFSGFEIAYENVSMTNASRDWVRVNILNSGSEQISMGNNPYYRYRGLLIFQIFCKLNTGVGKSTRLADEISDLFTSQRISGITFQTPSKDSFGEVGGWYQSNVSIPFFREDS